MPAHFETIADLVKKVNEAVGYVASKSFACLDGDVLTYNDYMAAKNSFRVIIQMGAFSILLDNGLEISASDMGLPNNLPSSTVEVANSILLSYLRNVAGLYCNDLNYEDGFDCAKAMSSYLFSHNGYAVKAEMCWKSQEYNLKQEIYTTFEWVDLSTSFYEGYRHSTFRLKSPNLKREIDVAINKLARIASENKFDSLIDGLIDDLKGYPRGTCPEDYELDDFWEEICIQAQLGESYDWELYVDMVQSLVEKTVKDMDFEDRLKLWLYAKSVADYDETDLEFADEDENHDYITATLERGIYQSIMSNAGSYESEALSRAIDGPYYEDDEDGDDE